MSILALAFRPTVAADEPTSLLTHLAGEFAPRIARLWPAPHAAFVTAAVERRHLVCLAMAAGREVAPHRSAALAGPLRKVLRDLLPDAPNGLARALGRLGEVAWAGDDYRRLLALLADPRGAKALRHAERISCNIVRRLAILPPPMSGALYLAWELSDAAAATVREVYEAIAFRSGRASADAAAGRWAMAETCKALIEAADDDLCVELPAVPFTGTERLRPLTTKAAMRDAARRFENCLAGRVWRAACGDFVYFEWTGPPGAIVEITRCHVFGWRVDEARGPGNAPVPEAARPEIMRELALIGVHTGRSGWELSRVLSGALTSGFDLRPPGEAVGELFGDD